MRQKSLAAGLLLFILFSAMASASATPPADKDVDLVRVSYADLDIEKEAGAAKLYSRFRNAAKKFCGVDYIHVYRELGYTRKSRECYAATLDALVAKMDSELVNELHSG